jgi:hypothetical protein
MTRLGSALLISISLAACGGPIEDEAATTRESICSSVRQGRELMIRSLSVVNDPVRTQWTGSTNARDGAWHFGKLMAHMAGSNDPSQFVRDWLGQWERDRTINGDVVPARPNIRSLVIDAWPKLADGSLDLTRAPMRLLAIVSRMDLRDLSAGIAGEGRFVFGVLDRDGNTTQFTVILEYALLASTDAEVLGWASAWHNLGALDPATETYRAALQRVTDRFARGGVAPSRPNGSAISQVRTNEIALAFPWELREFRLRGTPAQLREVTVIKTPRNDFDGSTVLRDFVNTNEAAILAGTHTVPLTFQGQPFRAGAVTNNIDFWSAAGIRNNDARQLFSVNTCNGCHGAETGTAFLHVAPRQANALAPLSGFLTGITVSDPVSGVPRSFSDLSRRAADLQSLVCATP